MSLIMSFDLYFHVFLTHWFDDREYFEIESMSIFSMFANYFFRQFFRKIQLKKRFDISFNSFSCFVSIRWLIIRFFVVLTNSITLLIKLTINQFVVDQIIVTCFLSKIMFIHIDEKNLLNLKFSITKYIFRRDNRLSMFSMMNEWNV